MPQSLLNSYAYTAWRLALITSMLIISIQRISAQHIEERFEISFRQDADKVDSGYSDNSRQLERLSTLFDHIGSDSLESIKEINIRSWASPDTGVKYNKELSERRSESIRQYILDRWNLPDTLIISTGEGIAWGRMRDLVAQSEMEHRDEILYILENEPEETWRKVNPHDRWLTMVDSRNKRLMDLKSGVPYMYMKESIFPQMRYGSVVSIRYKSAEAHDIKEPIFTPSELSAAPLTPYPAPAPAPSQESAAKRSLQFAVKTNLLFDAASLINIELEVPIGERWSIYGEWIFPWWTWDNGEADSKRHCLQLLNGNAGCRYWFGDRSDRMVMTGWFASLYMGGGLYDLERSGKGYQGEFFIASGVGGGFAHTINKRGSLRMEYSLGVGYLKTNYVYYESTYDVDMRWHSVRQKTGNYTWMGPTQLKVSLSWMININRGGQSR